MTSLDSTYIKRDSDQFGSIKSRFIPKTQRDKTSQDSPREEQRANGVARQTTQDLACGTCLICLHKVI